MQKIYEYKGETYTNVYAVKRAIERAENKRFGPEPTGPVNTLQKWWAANGVTYSEQDDPEVEPYEPTPEEVEAQRLEEAKRERAEDVEKITVTVDGMVFDGDETAQDRMGRTVAAAVALGVDLDTYTQTWVLADNTVAQPTIRQLAQALKLAGEAQTELWTVPYEAQADAAS